MKILFATGIYPPDIGGPATYAKLLFDQLPKRGFEVRVISFGEVRKLPKIVRHLVYACKLFMAAFSVDIIFAQDTVSAAFPALWVVKILRKRFIVRVPGDYAWEQATQRFGVDDSIDEFQNKRYGMKVEFLRKIQRMVVNGADAVITPSLYFKDLVSKWVKKPEKVFCIYNGIDLTSIPAFNGKVEPKTIISAGRLVPWKGFVSLIKWMKDLPDWKLSIAGDGPMRRGLEDLTLETGVKDRVTFLGQVPRGELIERIQKSEVFVLNTSFESFSFQIVEAMAAGTPVVATDIGNLAEIIDDGVSGILLKPDDEKAFVLSIQKLSSDTDYRNRMIAAAKDKAKRFSVETTLDMVANRLKKL
ncbi:MAG: glycosyltransferase family 4 protein [Candidatus Taylorbacteria bacterium]|nr:glycosyltransferase family 4 protein [Candidatus Taylorbacteria bacterium]